MKTPRQIPLIVKFLVGIAGTLTVALLAAFFVLAHQQERLIMAQIEREARVLFRQVVITRAWIADHGGVFIEKLPNMRRSPYLSGDEISDRSGKKYLLKTPAMITKELSRYAEEQGLYWFHITSLKLTNPENAPDAFEQSALAVFERNQAQELFTVEQVNKKPFLRYIAPLHVEEGCLKCHAHQGYKLGDVRGAISITLPIEKTYAEIGETRRDMAIAGVLTVLTLAGVLFIMIRKLVLTPTRRLKSSIHAFSAGKYTQDDIIATSDEFEELSRSFAEMAATINSHHISLHEKISAATKDLADTNEKLRDANVLLHEADLRKSDFVARASHELRTPLTSIKGAMDYISTRMTSLSQSKQSGSVEDLLVFFELIKKNTERLIRMVNDMLDIERIEMGVSELHLAETDLAGLVDEVLASFFLEAEQRRIVFERLGIESLPLCVDEDRIRQVLINLVSNGLKYAPDNSCIQVKLDADEAAVRLEVADSGPGIPEDEQSRIFERFYRLGDKEGTGLGLAVCKSIVEAHGGEISVIANEPNGSRFICTFPLQRSCGTIEA
jgi:signal transduction histidine kinase